MGGSDKSHLTSKSLIEGKMKFQRIIFLTLILAISACTTNIVPTATQTNIPILTIRPSATPTDTPTLTPTPDPFAIAERIQYDINKDIWVNREGKTENGETKTYVFSGVAGQQIYLNTQYPSNLVDGGWIETTKIFDENGELIAADSTTDMGGWEGKLQSTQDYLISLIPVDDMRVEFVLQIVNIPPRQESGYFTYADEKNGFEITYSQDDFMISGTSISAHDIFSVFVDTDKYFPDTILQLSHLTISSETRPLSTDCYDPLADTYYSAKEVINGISFKKYSLHDAATGTEAELVYYMTTHNDKCYQIFIRTLYMRVDKFPDTGLKDFSRSILYSKYYRLLNTFKFTE